MKLVATTALVLALAASGAPAFAHAGHDHTAAAPQTAEGEGVVKGLDGKAGTVTLAHGPIAALGWPAMTMTFKLESPTVTNGVAVGAKVHFTLKNQNGKPVVSALHVM